MARKANPRNNTTLSAKKSHIKHPLTKRAQIKASVTATRVSAARKTGRNTLTDILIADLL